MHKIRTQTGLLLLLTTLLFSCGEKAPVFDFTLFPASEPFIDAGYYRHELLQNVDLWNGGLDGHSGMEVDSDSFNGIFQTELSRDWKRKKSVSQSTFTQSRGIYMNAEASRHAPQEKKEKYLAVLRKGTRGLLNYFRDKDYGGYYSLVLPSGEVEDDTKEVCAQFQALFALTRAFQVTAEPAFYQALLDQIKIIETHFMDQHRPGTLIPALERNFSPSPEAFNTLESFCYALEALLAFNDLAEGELELKTEKWITDMGNYLCDRLTEIPGETPPTARLSFYYSRNWRPARGPFPAWRESGTKGEAAAGYLCELATLLSLAAEQGFPSRWLEVAHRYINYSLAKGVDADWGGLVSPAIAHDGKRLAGITDKETFPWWAQAEGARCFLHFSVMRGLDLQSPFKKLESMIATHLKDREAGGWYSILCLNRETEKLYPCHPDKGNYLKTNYYCTKFYVEALRLEEWQSRNSR